MGNIDPTVQSVINKFNSRSNIGMEKYKTTMAGNKGDAIYWLKNLQEELQDAILYAERLIEELNNLNNRKE